jgi:hypothetical protein
MAYEGPITYANIPFDKVEWSTDCLLQSGEETGADSNRAVLKAVARDIKLDKLDMQDRVKLDEGASRFGPFSLRGIVLGKDKKRESRAQVHYVLLVTLSEDESEQAKVYVRVGVAWLLEHNIARVGENVVIY